MRRFKVTCDHCNGTGRSGDCDWCEGSGYHIVTTQGDKVPLGAFEEIELNKSKEITNIGVIGHVGMGKHSLAEALQNQIFNAYKIPEELLKK